jgi:hypothetical protein
MDYKVELEPLPPEAQELDDEYAKLCRELTSAVHRLMAEPDPDRIMRATSALNEAARAYADFRIHKFRALVRAHEYRHARFVKPEGGA